MPHFGHHAPDIDKLAARRDVDALIDALSYARNQVGQGTRIDTAEAGRVVTGAVAALAEIGDPRAIMPMLQCFADDPVGIFGFDRRGIGPASFEPAALARFGPPAVDALIVTLGQRNQRTKAIAAVALGLIADQRAIPALLAAGEDPHQVIWALGNIGGNGQVTEALIHGLTSAFSEVQWNATHALGSGKFGKAARDALIDIVEHAPSHLHPPYTLALVALCEMGDERGLEEVLAHGAGWQSYLLLAIGAFDDPRVPPFLAKHLEGSYAEHRAAGGEAYLYAALGLAARGDPAAVRPLVSVLCDPQANREIPEPCSPRTLAALATTALLGLGSGAVEPLDELSRDPDPRMRAGAGSVLAALRQALAGHGVPAG